MRVLHEGLGDSKYRPCPLLVQYVDAGEASVVVCTDYMMPSFGRSNSELYAALFANALCISY